MKVTVHWNHHFWGDYHASIMAFFPRGSEHIAKAFGKRFLGKGYRIKEVSAVEIACGIFTSDNIHEAIRKRLEAARIENDKCERCGEIHTIGDTAHSIDRTVPITIELGYVEHPNQQTLFKE